MNTHRKLPIQLAGDLAAWRLSTCARLLAAGALTVLSAAAWSASVTFAAIDLADTTPGEDRWQYDYAITGPLAQFNAVNLLFPAADFANLNIDGIPDPASLDMLLTQPDPALSADGQATATALLDLGATFSGNVRISFDWTGTGTPGSQPYEVLDDQFNVITRGTTQPRGTPPPIPEPATALLLIPAAAAALAMRRRQPAPSRA